MPSSWAALSPSTIGRWRYSTPNQAAMSAWSGWLLITTGMSTASSPLRWRCRRSLRQCDSRDTSRATSRTLVGEAQRPAHRELLDHRPDGGSDLVAGDGEAVELELDALEEGAVGVVGVLLEVDDVAAVGRDERGRRRRRCRDGRGQATSSTALAIAPRYGSVESSPLSCCRRRGGRRQLAVDRRRGGVEADEAHEVDGRRRRPHGGDGDRCGRSRRVAVDAGGDRREGDGPGADAVGLGQRPPVARREQVGLAGGAAAPHRTDGVDHPARRQGEAGRRLGVAGGAAAELAAGVEQLRAGGTVDRPVDSAAAEQ